MAECLQAWSDAHPLCLGVAYHPDMEMGFGNQDSTRRLWSRQQTTL